MKLELCIPTLNRPRDLERLLSSIQDSEVRITVSEETEPRALTLIVNELFANATGDIVCILADHLEFAPDTTEAIRRAFQTHFANLDGMVGLNITNMPPNPGVLEYCFPAIGRRFIERFPGRQVFCPDYYHFYADTELGMFANSIGKFHLAEDAEVINYHFANKTAPMDDTHRVSRSRKSQDDDIWRRRQAAGLLWGKEFTRINDAT